MPNYHFALPILLTLHAQLLLYKSFMPLAGHHLKRKQLCRLSKTMEGCNIKLSSFVTHITGLSSRNLISAAMQGDVTEELIEALTIGMVKEKKVDLVHAMDGVLLPIQKKLIAAILDQIDDMTRRIDEVATIISG
jgi:transposase